MHCYLCTATHELSCGAAAKSLQSGATQLTAVGSNPSVAYDAQLLDKTTDKVKKPKLKQNSCSRAQKRTLRVTQWAGELKGRSSNPSCLAQREQIA